MSKLRCARCGKKIPNLWFHGSKLYVSYRTNGTGYLSREKSFTICDECGLIANSLVSKFIDELTYSNNPLSNGPYIIGQDFNTKDWWIYDDTQNKKLSVRFDTYEEAYDHTNELLEKEVQNENTTKEQSDETE